MCKANKLERLIKKIKGRRRKKLNRRSYKKNKRKRQSSELKDSAEVKTAVNLSSEQLSTSEISLLCKGLTFCPLPSRPDTFQLKKDLIQFSRRLRLKEYFWDSEDDNEEDVAYKLLRRASVWTPLVNRDAALESYIKLINDNIQEQIQTPRKCCRDNLTKEERQALVSLRTRTDIVIKKADKGSATVVMSRQQYVTEVMRHLQNQYHYEKLPEDPTEVFFEEIKAFLEDMVSRHSIDKKTMASLLVKNSKPSRFYILPKIHKPGNPGRPIVSSCGSSTEGILHFVDYHLAPLVKEIPSFIKDTTDFLNRIETIDNLPSDTLLVTLDVRSLYTNIPHSEGIEACRAALNTRQVLQPPTEDLIHLIKLILTKNNFTFEEEHYLQIHGTTMGTRMAPSYANLFMGNLERKILDEVEKKPDIWWR